MFSNKNYNIVLSQVKKESAETEPAWKGAGQKVGIQIWRINKFKVNKSLNYGRGGFIAALSLLSVRLSTGQRRTMVDFTMETPTSS